jgi:hypothetical protein
MSLWLYSGLCVVVPAIWGVAMYFAFNALSARRRAEQSAQDPPPIDYSI